MKKATAFLLLVIYLLGSTGFSVAAHFCGSKLSSFSITSQSAHKCKCSKKAKKNDNCCSSKKAFLKIKTEHKVQSNTSNVQPAQTIIPGAISCFRLPAANPVNMCLLNAKAPPGQKDNPLFIRLHSLLI